jgi:putative endonuclease
MCVCISLCTAVRFRPSPLLRKKTALVCGFFASQCKHTAIRAQRVEAVSCEALAKQDYNAHMYFVYILQSKKDDSLYVGMTEDVKQRLAQHNNGNARYSSSKRPYALKWFCGFASKKQAFQFEKYLKQGSGFAFARKHLIN